MGLLIVDHLHAVLDHAQKLICRRHFVGDFRRDPVTLRQGVEDGDRPIAAQMRRPAAGDQLLGLDEELDLANTAAPKFYIMPGDRDLARGP